MIPYPREIEAEISALDYTLFTRLKDTCYTAGGYSHPHRAAIRRRAEREILTKRARAIDLPPALEKQLTAGVPAALTEVIERIGAAMAARVLWREAGADFIPYVAVNHRDVHLSVIDRPMRFDVLAGALHEFGHLVSELCQGPDHPRLRGEDNRGCLSCEANSWVVAFEIAPTCVLANLQDMAREALASYKAAVPGTRAAFQRVERVRSGLVLREQQMARIREALPYIP